MEWEEDIRPDIGKADILLTSAPADAATSNAVIEEGDGRSVVAFELGRISWNCGKGASSITNVWWTGFEVCETRLFKLAVWLLFQSPSFLPVLTFPIRHAHVAHQRYKSGSNARYYISPACDKKMADFAVKIFFDTLYAVLPAETIRNQYLTVIIGGVLAAAVTVLATVFIRLLNRTAQADLPKITPAQDIPDHGVWVPYNPASISRQQHRSETRVKGD